VAFVDGDTREVERAESINLLERMLIDSAFHVEERGGSATNEADVRRFVFEALRHVFPDIRAEAPISQISQKFIVDFAIPSLSVGIEYKFVDSLQEAKGALQGLYADMHGYQGGENQKFYAVIYCTRPTLTAAQIESEFRDVQAPESWKPIVVIGPGGRRRKKPAGKRGTRTAKKGRKEVV
jgi:hypothetical protein